MSGGQQTQWQRQQLDQIITLPRIELRAELRDFFFFFFFFFSSPHHRALRRGVGEGEGDPGVEVLERRFSEKASHGCECLHPQRHQRVAESSTALPGDQCGEGAYQLAGVLVDGSSKPSDGYKVPVEAGDVNL